LAQGRSEEAVAAMAEAHAAMPEQPDVLFNLANAQRQAGYLETAAIVSNGSSICAPTISALITISPWC